MDTKDKVRKAIDEYIQAGASLEAARQAVLVGEQRQKASVRDLLRVMKNVSPNQPVVYKNRRYTQKADGTALEVTNVNDLNLDWEERDDGK